MLFISHYTYSDDELDKLRAEVTPIDWPSPSCIPSRPAHSAQEEKDQPEDSEEGSGPPKKVLVGWGGNAALEKAPIDLRQEFKRHVKDAQPSPKSKAQTNAKAELSPKQTNQQTDTGGPTGWTAEVRRSINLMA